MLSRALEPAQITGRPPGLGLKDEQGLQEYLNTWGCGVIRAKSVEEKLPRKGPPARGHVQSLRCRQSTHSPHKEAGCALPGQTHQRKNKAQPRPADRCELSVTRVAVSLCPANTQRPTAYQTLCQGGQVALYFSAQLEPAGDSDKMCHHRSLPRLQCLLCFGKSFCDHSPHW